MRDGLYLFRRTEPVPSTILMYQKRAGDIVFHQGN